MRRAVSLESFMKWMFLLVALSTAALILGTRLHQSYTRKLDEAAFMAERAERLLSIYRFEYSSVAEAEEELGPYWRPCMEGEPAEMQLAIGGGVCGFVIDYEAIYADMVEEERYLILVGILGLIVAVELAVFLSYILTRFILYSDAAAAAAYVDVPGDSGGEVRPRAAVAFFSVGIFGAYRKLQRHVCAARALARGAAPAQQDGQACGSRRDDVGAVARDTQSAREHEDTDRPAARRD